MHCSYNNTPTLVITMGSYNCRAGFSCENTPRSVFRTVLGRCVNGNPGINVERTLYHGKEAIQRQTEISIFRFIEYGIITNWDDFEEFTQKVFYSELKVAPEEHAVLLSEIPIGPKANREKTTQIMFESFNVGALHLKLDMVLAMIASGRLTGTVVSSGGTVSHVIPVYLGYGLPHAILRLDQGGDNVTEHLVRLFTERGYDLTSLENRERVNEIKEELAYISQDYQKEMSQVSSLKEEWYSLPDGNIVKIGSERFRCAEIMFNPCLIGRESCGLTESVYDSIMKSDVDIRKLLYGNIVLSGGNAMIKGMDTRLARDLTKLAPRSCPVEIISLPDKDLLSWFGGAIFSSLLKSSDVWVTKAEYDDCGPSIIHRKCF
ncbi:actin [Oopsacas minuta]|uniref:Actin n=1 Tax=Oopsacas minuta TaxID=111878 RepID=A0AAV7KA03_9METZ|nr:actin [Oopsacas minuta]